MIRVWGEKVCVSISAESLHPSTYLKYFRGDSAVFCSIWQQIRGRPEDSGIFGLKMNLLCSQSSSNTAQDENSSLSLSTSDVHIVSISWADLSDVWWSDVLKQKQTFSSDVRDFTDKNWLNSQFHNDCLGKHQGSPGFLLFRERKLFHLWTNTLLLNCRLFWETVLTTFTAA